MPGWEDSQRVPHTQRRRGGGLGGGKEWDVKGVSKANKQRNLKSQTNKNKKERNLVIFY